jgi:hypothetical protein
MVNREQPINVMVRESLDGRSNTNIEEPKLLCMDHGFIMKK